jgi:hypothetical protein
MITLSIDHMQRRKVIYNPTTTDRNRSCLGEEVVSSGRGKEVGEGVGG